MTFIYTALQQRAETNNPIRVGLIGAGYAARGVALQLLTGIPGIQLTAVANRTLSNAKKAYQQANIQEIITVDTAESFEQALQKENAIITDNPSLLIQSPAIDVIVEATGEVEFGAQIAIETITHKKHLVLVNAELDSTLGPILKVKADKAGVIYTQADGDQPAVIMNLYREVQLLGFTPKVLGNSKTVLDHHRTPETQKAWAKANGQNPTLATTAVDGTKIAMEMATVANATGFGSGKRGMFGPKCADIIDAPKHFELDSLKQKGIVDYILGAQPSFGVFIIATSDNPIKQAYMKMYKMGDGPYYTFYRPFHLCTLEAHLSIAHAVLVKEASLAPIGEPVCDVISIAKRDLKKGETLDGIGGFSCYGLLENYEVSTEQNFLPMGLTKGCVLIKDVAKDRVITYNDVLLPEKRLSDTLRQEQTEYFSKMKI